MWVRIEHAVTTGPSRTPWRPVGPAELRLLEAAGFRAFPPRLQEQPISYPVTNFAYTEQIARDWNSKYARHDQLAT